VQDESDIFSLPPGYKGRRIARRIITTFVIGLVFTASILFCLGLLAYQYFLNKKLALNYQEPTMYLVGVNASNTEYIDIFQNDGYAGYMYDNLIVARVFDNQEKADEFLDSISTQYPTIVSSNVPSNKLRIQLDNAQISAQVDQAFDYYYNIINKLNQYVDELFSHSTSGTVLQSRIRRISTSLAEINSKLKSLNIQSQEVKSFMTKIPKVQIELSNLTNQNSNSKNINSALCSIYLDK